MRSAGRSLVFAAGLALLAGCDGGLHLAGRVVSTDGEPVPHAPVYFYRNGKADAYDPVLWTDAEGDFSLDRLDCPCDFPIELVAFDARHGLGRLITDHDTIEKDDAPPLEIVLVPPPRIEGRTSTPAADCAAPPTPGDGVRPATKPDDATATVAESGSGVQAQGN